MVMVVALWTMVSEATGIGSEPNVSAPRRRCSGPIHEDQISRLHMTEKRDCGGGAGSSPNGPGIFPRPPDMTATNRGAAANCSPMERRTIAVQ